MSSIKAVLYKSKTYKDGSHPVVLQIIHNRKVRKKSLNLRLFENEWDFEKGLPKKNYHNYKEASTAIRIKIAEAEKSLLKLESDKPTYSINELSSRIIGKNKRTSFNDLAMQIVNEMNYAKRHGNAASYQSALKAINDFTGNKTIWFTDIDYKFLKKFENHHLSKGNTINGFNTYMRAVRAIFNRAIKEQIVSADSYPFKDYQIKQKKTLKRAISKEEMKAIVNLKLEEESNLWHTRNFFIFSFFTIGMSWIDLAMLEKKNIKGDRIIYKRSKTGKEYNIKINDNIKEILSYYQSKSNKYVFPIINRDKSEQDKRNDIRNYLKRYNKRLKTIGQMANTSIELTSYVSRHSWASIANFSGVAIGVISQGLGHEDIKTTQTYLANFDYSDIDNANDNIL
jgi:site-specific recombinase XerD